ncbi:hypothetical protein BGP84_01130 [Pseudomonas putida]|uniref:Helix-turn-helix domain-containing protein n=1 Tax=Pseudomonas putida TaxID=303 RepID=A0A2S3X9Y1_PSEPU|nr:hypothetical protein [Pseudomonas putida]POG01247.1 hypothetical protein BGP85_22375 [Pseudomonas putida]POG11912.1 hypothetical protein BGP84_01130 [Pseudomonas putida]
MSKPVNVEKATPTLFYAKQAPYSSVSNDVVAMIANPDALAIWIYLQTRSSDWKVIGSYLQDRFSIGRDRYSKAMAYLKEIGLVSHEVVREEGTGKVLGRRVIVHYEPNLQVSEYSVNRSVGSPNGGETDSYSIKDSSTESRKKPDVADAPELVDFERFWKIYPRKVSKADAKKAWAKIKVTADLFALMAKALAAWTVSTDWTKDGGQFIPHASTWLNGKRWEDELPQPAAAKPAAPRRQSNEPDFNDSSWAEGLMVRT